MDRKKIITDNLLVSLIDSWNENNIMTKANPDFINSIRLHIDNAYTVGVEDAFKKINREFNKYKANTTVSCILMKQIINPKTYEL